MTDAELDAALRPYLDGVFFIATAGGSVADALAALPPPGADRWADLARGQVGRIVCAAREIAARKGTDPPQRPPAVTTFGAAAGDEEFYRVVRPFCETVFEVGRAGGTVAEALLSLPPRGRDAVADQLRVQVGRFILAGRWDAGLEPSTFAAWTESDHPRGRPGNRGQWAKKGGGAGGGGKPAGKRAKRRERDRDRDRTALAAAVAAADPSLARRPKLVARLADAGVTAVARLKLFLLRHQEKIDALGSVLGAVLDTPQDLTKLGYNPSTSSGTAGANPNFDPARAAGLPVSGHVLAAVAANVLARVFSWGKKRLRGTPQTMAAGDAAGVLIELLELIAELLGLPRPDPTAVRAALATQTFAASAREWPDIDDDDDDDVSFGGSTLDVTEQFAAWERAKHPRGQPDNAGWFAPKGGGAGGAGADREGARHEPGPGPGDGRNPSEPAGGGPAPAGDRSESSRSAAVPLRKPTKATHAARKYRDTARRRRVIKAVKNEGELSAAIRGSNLPDSEPADVVVMTDPEGKPITDPAHVKAALKRREWAVRRLKQANLSDADREHCRQILATPCAFVEVKTLLVAKGNAVHISGPAQKRKERWIKKFAATFHTCALDDRRGAKHSGNRVYVVHGFAGTVRLDQMQQVPDLAAVGRHIEATGEEGKVEARRVAGVHFSQGEQS